MKEFRDLIISIVFIVLGLYIGSIGLVAAGYGIVIPLIPIGLYFLIRWFRNWICYKSKSLDSVSFKGIKIYDKNNQPIPEVETFEFTKFGQICLGIMLLFVAIAGSALLISLPFIGIGAFLIYKGIYRNALKKDSKLG